jgi:putative SOS response-associated peptidase YedK
MCANYQPVTRMDRMLTFFGVERGPEELPQEVFPTGLAPFIRRAEEGSGHKRVETGAFGLLPFFAKEIAYGRRTYNARSETVASLASFRDAWRRGQRCIVPAEAIYEPNWETGRAVRWRISQEGEVPMAIAGLYTRWRQADGNELFSFAMLTVNADGHPVMQRFHRPGEEKRMVVILDPAEQDRWLACTPAEASAWFKPWLGPLVAQPAPLVRTARPAGSSHEPPALPRASPKPGAGPQTDSLF